MKVLDHYKKISLVLLTLTCSVLINMNQSFAITLNDLDASRRVNWKAAGYPGQIPEINKNIVNVKEHGALGNGIKNDHTAIQTTINKATDPSVIYFPPGVYRINSSLSLKSGVILRGAGSASTRLEFYSDNGCIEITGTKDGDYLPITEGLTKGSTQLTVNNVSGFQIGHGAEIRQEDIDAVDPTGEWGENQDWVPTHVMGQMVKIVDIKDKQLTIYPPLHIDFNADKNPEIMPVTYKERIGVEDLTIKRLDTGKISSNINIKRAADCWFRRIESDQTQKYHFSISNSLHLEIRGCYIHDAYHKGGGGRGYGTSLGSYVTSVLVEDNIFSDLRHSMIIQLGTNGCVFGYNYAQRNYDDNGKDKTYISVHGHYPYMNLFEGNIAGFAGLADYWGASGPGNTLFRNRIVGTDEKKDFGPHRGIMIKDHSHRQNIIGNELTGNETRIYYDDGNVGISQATSKDLIVHGNNVHGTIDWDPRFGDQKLPASFYQSVKPPFFGELSWPAMGPDVTIGAGTIPALQRYSTKKYVVQPGDEGDKKPYSPSSLRVILPDGS